MRPRVLIFDLDGTLLDSMTSLLDIFCELLYEQRGIEPGFSREVAVMLMGMNTRFQMAEVLSRAGLPQTGLEALNELYGQRSALLEPRPFAEVPGVLTGLQSAGYSLFVSSGGRPTLVARRAELSGISGFFKLVLGTDEADPCMAKGPAHFRLIAGAMGFPGEEMHNKAWLIGDGAYDMRVAREAGIRAIGRLTGDNAAHLREAGANVLIKDLTELPPLLDGAIRQQ